MRDIDTPLTAADPSGAGAAARPPRAEMTLKGASGAVYRFAVWRRDDAFEPTAAVYAFARPGFDGRGFVPVFLSRTGNLEQRLMSHERWAEARLLGATHVLVHIRDERAAREQVEADLLAGLRPVMNEGEALIEENRPQLRLVWAA